MLKRTKLSDQVYDFVLQQISTQAIPPGAPLREMDLVAQLKVSRTPIREALARLTKNGLVEKTGGRARVRSLTVADTIHIYQARRALEGAAIRLACGHVNAEDLAWLTALVPAESDASKPEFDAACFKFDIELHRLIGRRSRNPILAREIQRLHDVLQLLHRSIADSPGRLIDELRQHVRILEGLKIGDRKLSHRALMEHLRSACTSQIKCLKAARETSPKEMTLAD